MKKTTQKLGNVQVEVESNVDETLEEMRQAIQRALNAMGLQMERNAKIEIQKSVYDTPPSPSYKRTGRLRASLTYATKTQHSKGGSEAEAGDYAPMGTPDEDKVYVGTNVEYAAYVEFGTSKMKAKPYLKPAIADHLSEYEEIVRTELND